MRYTIFLLSLKLLAACTKDTTSSGDVLYQPEAEATAEAGTESSAMIDEVENDLEMIEDLDNVDLDGTGDFKLESFATNFSEMVKGIEEMPRLKVLGDTLLYVKIDTIAGVIFKTRITWDSDTEMGNIYQIRIFPEDVLRALVYDSTHIAIDMGSTPFDPSDDIFKSAYHYREYRPDFQLESFTASFVLNEVNENYRPIDFTATIDLKYRDGALISSAHKSLIRHSDRTGEFHRRIDFADGSVSLVDRYYNGDGTGTVHRELPSGVVSDGTFNLLRDDGVGGFARTTVFPTGFKLSSIEATGDFTLDNLILNGEVVKIYNFADGTSDTVTVTIVRHFTQDRFHHPLSTQITVSSTSGISSEMTIINSATDAMLSGWWITADDHYVTISGYRYFRELATLNLAMYENKEAFDDGVSPIATAYFETHAGGHGVATITINGEVYTFTYHANGRGKLRKLGRIISTIEANI